MNTARGDVLSLVADAIIRVADDDRILRVGIDGVDGAGKTTFADRLTVTLRERGRVVIHATVDGFHRPRADRYRRGRHSPEGFYLDSYDYDALRRALLDPLGPDGDRRYRQRVFDVNRDEAVDEPIQVAVEGSILVFDGIFLHRPELREVWDLTVFLRVAWERNHHLPSMFERGWTRDLTAPEHQRYIQGQRIYLDSCDPEARSTIVIDNEDFSRPVVLVDRSRS